MSLESFKRSAIGGKLAPIFASEDAVRRMIRKSESGRPAVEAIGKDVEAAVGRLDNEHKKLVGRWAKEALAPRGWVPDRKGRVARGHFFARGTVYRRAHPPAARLDGPARLKRAWELVRQLPYEVMGSEELIAERRRAFERGD